MRTKLICIISLLFFSILLGQYSSDGPVVLKNGERLTNKIYIKFLDNINLSIDNKIISLTDFPLLNSETDLKSIFTTNLLYVKANIDSVTIKRTFTRITKEFLQNNTSKIKERMARVVTVKTNTLYNLEKLISDLNASSIVDFCHGPIETVTLTYPDDPYFEDDTQWELIDIDAEDAWGITHGDDDIIVGMIDPTGHAKSSLSELDSKVTILGDTSYADHATKIASIICAETNNDYGMASLNAEGLLYSYAYTADNTYNDDLVDAIEDAVGDSCHIINMSFKTIKTGYTSCFLNKTEENGQNSSKRTTYYYYNHNYGAVSLAIEDAVDAGVICVASAGNESETFFDNLPCESIPYPAYPASYDDVIAVTASDEDEDFETDYNYGSFVDVNAPGVDVLVLDDDGSFDSVSGTSASAGFVSALIALMLDNNSEIEHDDIIRIFNLSSDKIDSYDYTNGWNNRLGYGRINAYHALLGTGNGSAPSTPSNFALTTIQQGSTFRPKLTWDQNTEYDLTGYEIWRKLDGESYTKIATLDYDVTEYVDVTLIIFSSGNFNTAYYKMRAIDIEAYSSSYTSELSVDYRIDLKKGKEDNDRLIPDYFALYPCSPNPFNPTTRIFYDLPKEALVKLTIYNSLGQKVKTLINTTQKPNRFNVLWDGKNEKGQSVSSGIYFYRIQATSLDNQDHFIKTNKMIFAK